jgi:CRISPR-associated protein Csd2
MFKMLLDRKTQQKVTEVSDSDKRYDFVFLVDIGDGNPNGDPDQDNRPRLDEETGEGLMTDVCIKRKIRDYIDETHGDEARNAIYVLNRRGFLQKVNTDLKTECEADSDFVGGWSPSRNDEDKNPYVKDKNGKITGLKPAVYSDYACNKWFDWRCFGAVPGKPIDSSTVRGPVQMRFGRSAGRVTPIEHGIGRVVQNEKSSTQQGDEVHGTFGAKHTVRYGLYRFAGHYSAFLAKRTKFNDEDLSLFWEAMINWPQTDSSAARPYMGVRGLYVFKHSGTFGNAPAHDLLALVKVSQVDYARGWEDYQGGITAPPEGPVEGWPGVTFHKLVG